MFIPLIDLPDTYMYMCIGHSIHVIMARLICCSPPHYIATSLKVIQYYFCFCLQARNWIRELRRMLGDNIVVCIVGNKIDLEKNRTVSQRDAERSVVL